MKTHCSRTSKKYEPTSPRKLRHCQLVGIVIANPVGVKQSRVLLGSWLMMAYPRGFLPINPRFSSRRSIAREICPVIANSLASSFEPRRGEAISCAFGIAVNDGVHSGFLLFNPRSSSRRSIAPSFVNREFKSETRSLTLSIRPCLSTINVLPQRSKLIMLGHEEGISTKAFRRYKCFVRSWWRVCEGET